MKTLLLLLLPCALCWAQGPRGHWSGAIEIANQQPLAVEIDLDLAANAWIGSLSIPEQSVSGVPLENFAYVNGRFTFRARGTPGAPTFAATVAPDGKTMSGDFTKDGKTFPFRLLRAGDAQVETPKSSPALADRFIGTWTGALLYGNNASLHLLLRMANDAAGAKAIVISLDHGGGEIPVNAVQQNGARVDLDITAIGASYKGDLNKEGTELTGTWNQAGQAMPLSFKKSVSR